MAIHNEKLDSNNGKTIINWVCSDCGREANIRTCYRKYKSYPKKVCFDVSTYHIGRCEFCGKEKPITQTRDFFYCDFNTIYDIIPNIHNPKFKNEKEI